MSSFPLNPIKETDPSIALTLDVLQRYVQNLFQANPLTISDERPLTTGAEAISLLLGKQLSAESDMLCALPEFIATKSVVWPATIRHACESSVQDNTVFLLENISRVAIRIQHKLILWNFLTGSDMKVIEEPEPVQNIFTVRTPPGLLNSNSTHLLLLIFCGKVSVYGLSFADRAIPGEYEFQGRKGSRCHVTPCTITDLGISQISEFTIQKIVQHDFTDRIFFAAQEGDFYEIHLVKDLRTDSLRMTFTNLDAFFSQQNYVSQCIGSLLTKAYLSVIKKEQALDICVDSFRHQIFVLHLDSSITMYSISEGGKGQISLICTKKHEPGMLQHLNKYRDPKLSPLSSVHIGGPREDFALVSVASNGYCYFYSLQESGFTGGKQLEVKKVFCSLDNDSREFRKSWFETEKQIAFSYVSNGIGAFIRTCSSESNQSENTSPPNVSSAMLMDEICFTSSSREVSLNANENTSLERPTVTIFPQRGSELQDMRMLYVGEIDHTVFASLCEEIASATPIQETDSQYILPSRRFAVVTNTGVHFVRKLRPLDILFLVISSGRTTSARSILARFQSTFGLEEFCSMLCLLYGKLASAHEFSELTLSLRKAQSECVSCSSRILSEKEISTFIWEILESRLLPDSASLVALDANYISGRDLTMSTFSQSRNTLFCITTSPAIRGLRLLFSRILLSLVPLRLFSPSSPSRPRPGLHLTEEDLRGVLEILTPLAHVLSTLRKQGWMEPNPSLPLFWENNDQFDTILSVPSNHTGLSSSHLKQLVALQLSSLEHTTHIIFQFLSLLQMVQTTKYEPVLIDTAATEYTRLSSQHSTPPLPYFHDLVFGDLLLSPSAPSVRLPVVRALLRSFLRVPDLTPAELSTLNSTMATKCPSLLPAEDFAEYHAQLLLRECHRSWGNDPTGANDKINDLVKALLPLSRHLWQSCGLRAIAEVLWEMKGYAAVASLCWSAAAQGDGKREAMGAYLYGIDPESYVQPSGRAQEALEDRWQCYGLLVSFLEQGFAGENSTTLNSSLRELFEVESGRIGSLWNLPGCDLLAKYFLLEWMLQRESSDPMREYFLQIVLRMPPGDLEKFLELHQSMFGRERALFYIKQDRSEDALRAFLSAATSRFVNIPVPLQYRVGLLQEATTWAKSKKVEHSPLARRLSTTYRIALVQTELLELCEQTLANESDSLSNQVVDLEDGIKPLRSHLAEQCDFLRNELISDLNILYRMAEVYRGSGGEFVQLSVLYNSDGTTETSKFLCADLFEAALCSASSVESTTQKLFERFYDPSRPQYFPMNSLLKVVFERLTSANERVIVDLLLGCERMSLAEIFEYFRLFFEEVYSKSLHPESRFNTPFSAARVLVAMAELLCVWSTQLSQASYRSSGSGVSTKSSYLTARQTCENYIRDYLHQAPSSEKPVLQEYLSRIHR